MRLGFGCEHSATLLAQALLVFQPAQFLGGTHGRLTVGAHAEPASRLEKAAGVEESIT